MGGFAVVIDWERPVDPRAVDPMMALVPHRATGGVRVHATTHAVLAEGRYRHKAPDGDWSVTSVGPLAIVGHIDLLDRGALRDSAGGRAATAGMKDRELILAAYRRSGLAFLEAADGDYAFVIWDDAARTAVAVRDRFAVRALFVEPTSTGVRFASEAKQLVATSDRPIALNDHIVAEFLSTDFAETRDTFFAGVERVRASDAVVFTASATRRIRYWNPAPDLDRTLRSQDVAPRVRELLVDSVSRRSRWAQRSVAHLSGGLDSSTVVLAAASALRGGAPDVTAVSAVYPGHPNDESEAINDLVARLPFPNRRFIPRIATIEDFDADMWTTDDPWVDRDRDQWLHTTEIAHELGATQVITGVGGDHLLDESWVIADRIRSGNLAAAAGALRAQHSWSGRSMGYLLHAVAARAAPARLKRALRAVVPRQDDTSPLLSGDLAAIHASRVPDAEPTSIGAPTLTADSLAHHARTAMASWIMELHDANLASRELEETNPYFDKALYEFVASIPPEVYPLDGRWKVLARLAFSDDLPPSVRDIRTKVTTTDYVRHLFTVHAPQYRARFPAVPTDATGHIDASAYAGHLKALDAGRFTQNTAHDLWQAWTYLAFREGLARYRSP